LPYGEIFLFIAINPFLGVNENSSWKKWWNPDKDLGFISLLHTSIEIFIRTVFGRGTNLALEYLL
jgi:hypothetical protein